jgi:hypothetical protein
VELTAKQQRALQSGHAIQVMVGCAPCVLLRKDVYERGEALDFSPWAPEEMDLLAAETADLLAGDGLDEADESCFRCGRRWRLPRNILD